MVKRLVRRLAATARREQLLEAALRVFSRVGLSGTGTRELAKAAGVTEPVLYQHFGGKEELFLCTLGWAVERIATELEVALEGAATAADQLLTLAEALQGLLADHLAELRMLCVAAASFDGAAQKKAVGAAVQRLGQVMVQGLQGRGLRRGVTATTAGWFLLQLGLGAALVRPLGVAALDQAELMAAVQAALLA